jgi:hypothetical protein
MDHIHQQNSIVKDDDRIVIPRERIGNGWTDPMNQYAAADAAYGTVAGRAQVAAFEDKRRKMDQLRAGHYTSSDCFQPVEFKMLMF